MLVLRKGTFLFLMILMSVGLYAQPPEAATVKPAINLTWMSNTNWRVETDDVCVLLDGWITRIPRPPRPDLQNLETLSCGPVRPDIEGIQMIHQALGKKKIHYIIMPH